MEGSEFRKLSSEEMDNIVSKLQVLARSSPMDKQLLVQHLKDIGETVAVSFYYIFINLNNKFNIYNKIIDFEFNFLKFINNHFF